MIEPASTPARDALIAQVCALLLEGMGFTDVKFVTTARVLLDHFIRTQTGRTYQVISVRTQQKGKHAGRRQHLRVLVVPETTPQPEDTVIPIRWYRR